MVVIGRLEWCGGGLARGDGGGGWAGWAAGRLGGGGCGYDLGGVGLRRKLDALFLLFN